MESITAPLKRYPLAFFVVLAYAISWLVWSPLLVGAAGLRASRASLAG